MIQSSNDTICLWSLFKINIKDTAMTSMSRFYTFRVNIVDFEQVNDGVEK